MTRRFVRFEHEGRYYPVHNAAVLGEHRSAGAPPARPPRPESEGPDPTLELISRIDEVTALAAGSAVAEGAAIVEFPQPEPTHLQEAA